MASNARRERRQAAGISRPCIIPPTGQELNAKSDPNSRTSARRSGKLPICLTALQRGFCDHASIQRRLLDADGIFNWDRRPEYWALDNGGSVILKLGGRNPDDTVRAFCMRYPIPMPEGM